MTTRSCNLDAQHNAERYALYDARGIFCTYVCARCEDDARRGYRVEIFEDASYEASEDIDDN